MHVYQLTEKGSSIQQAKKALILLHGRGSNARDILSLSDYFTDESFYIAAPEATNNAWYPYSFMAPVQQNEPWLSSAIDVVNRLINETLKYIPAENCFLMGFSQGACLATEVAARNARPYAGVIAFTGALIGQTLQTENYAGNFNGTTIYLSNSNNDPHVPLHRSEESKNQLKAMKAKVELDVYPGRPHTISEEEIDKVKALFFPDSK